MISVIIAKLILALLRLINHGATTLPGKIALKINSKLLTHLSKGVRVICVTGTNGKTTTCALISNNLSHNGMSYFTNKSGANMITGVATAFVDNCDIFGRCKKDFAVLECDENSLPLIAEYIDAEIVVVTNVFRDQLDRYGEVNFTLNQISLAVSKMKSPILALNADCPLTMSLCNDNSVSFGLSSTADIASVSDNRYCPICNNELQYHSVVFAHLGDYYCTRCGYHRSRPNYELSLINDSVVMINGHRLLVSLKGTYNLYNILSAYAVCDLVGVKDFSGLSTFYGAFGRIEKFKYNDTNILVLLVKNPVGFANCIDLVSSMGGIYNIAFALNDNSADGTDVSWIWDVDFSSLSSSIDECYTLGTRSYDMALRLKYDDISSMSLDGECYSDLISIIKKSTNDFVFFSTYTSMMNMRHYLVDEFGGDEFWQ